MTSLVRAQTNQNGAERSGAVALRSTATMPTTVVSKTTVGDEIRTEVANTLSKFKTKRIEEAGNLTDEGVRLLKNKKRTISAETMIKLARSRGELGPAMWAAICKLCGRPVERIEHDSPELQNLHGALIMLAQGYGPVADFARALLRQMNATERPAATGVDREQIARESWVFHDAHERHMLEEEYRKSGYDPNGAVCDLFLFARKRA